MDTGLQCPVCCDTVCTVYGLWFHIMKRHPNQSTTHWPLRCPICHTVFKGLEKLDRHIHGSHLEMDLTPYHSSSSDDDEKVSGDAAKKAITSSKSFSSLVSTCPQEIMMQLDFSCTKFALVAQISADYVSVRKVTKASTACHACDRSFPCTAALDLHVRNLHDEASNAMSCMACGVCFVSLEQHREHMMLTHDAPQVVAEFLRSSEDADPRASKVTREEFLLVLGLKALPVTDDAADDVVPPRPLTKVVNVDANQNLLKTADVPASVSAPAANLATPLVLGPLMAVTAPVNPMFSSAVPVPLPSILPQDLSSHIVTPSTFRFIPASDAVTFLNPGSNSIQSIAAMTGTFPFISPFLPAPSVERKSPVVISNTVKNCSPVRTAADDGGTKSSKDSDAEESNRASMYLVN